MGPCEAVYPPASVWSTRTVRQNPLVFLEQLATQGDIVPFALAGHPAFLLNHPNHVEDVLAVNHAKFAKPHRFRRASALLGNGLLTAEGALHRERRQALQPSFSLQRMAGYGAIVVECAENARARWHDGQVVDIAAEMRDITLAIIGRVLFGLDLSRRAADIHRALAVASASLDPLLSVLAPPRQMRPARNRLRGIVNDLIDERHAAGDAGDLVSALCRADANNRVTDQLRDDVCTLFVAGHETIANALTWTWCLLAQHPEAERRLHDELQTTLGRQLAAYDDLPRLAYTSSVLSESLRLYPASWIITRRAIHDHEVGGTHIPTGALVLLSQYLVHRDGRFFPSPLSFRPERWAPPEQSSRPKLAYFPFGAGPRSCIGQGFAMMEGVLLLASLARYWRCRPAGTVDFDFRATLRPRGPVRMTLEAWPPGKAGLS
jgi:cytochrome P450